MREWVERGVYRAEIGTDGLDSCDNWVLTYVDAFQYFFDYG